MRAPYRTSVNPSNQPLAYLSSAGATPEAFGAGIGRSLASFGQTLATELQARQDKTDRFSSLRNFSDFETKASERLDELKRGADPSGKGFLDQATAAYDEMEKDFLASDVTPELRDEFSVRAAQVKQRVIGEAFDFQYKAGDAYFRQGISDELSKAQIALDKDPNQLEAWRKRLQETIAASDLSDIDKADVSRKAMIGLEGVAYKQNIKASTKEAGGVVDSNSPIGQIIDQAAKEEGVDPTTLRKIAWIESRGNPKAQNAGSSAGGLFQQTDANARQYGVADRMDPAQSARGAARFLKENTAYLTKVLGRAPTPGELYLAHQQGPAGAAALLKNPNAMAVDVVGADEVKGNGGTSGMTAGEFAALWTKRLDGAKIDFAGDIENDPAYNNLPYEDRLALRKDAENEAQAELNKDAIAQKAVYQAQLNGLMNSIMDGSAGQAQLDSAYDGGQGWLTDYQDRHAAQTALDQKNKEIDYVTRGVTKLETGEVWNPFSDDDKKSQNALVNHKDASGVSLMDHVQQMDTGAVSGAILPFIQRSHDIPTDLAGLLTGMVRSNNQSQALFALDTLSQMLGAEPAAFNQRFGDQLAKDVSLYNAVKDLYPADQIMSIVNGGTNAEERQRTIQLRQEGEDILQSKQNGVSTLSTLVNDFIGAQRGWFMSTPARSSWPASARALDAEYQTLFVEGYARMGDKEKADVYAKTALQKNWAVTEIGHTFMKYPPEKVGYPKIAGSYAWMDGQIKQDIGLATNERYELVSDTTTENEVRKTQAGETLTAEDGTPRGPSYQVVRFDAAGVPYLTKDANGNTRFYFHPTERMKQADVADAKRKQMQADYEEFMKGYTFESTLAAQEGKLVDPALQKQKEDYEKQLRTPPIDLSVPDTTDTTRPGYVPNTP